MSQKIYSLLPLTFLVILKGISSTTTNNNKMIFKPLVLLKYNQYNQELLLCSHELFRAKYEKNSLNSQFQVPNQEEIDINNTLIKVNEQTISSKNFEIENSILKTENLIKLRLNKSVLELEDKDIKRFSLEIRLKFSDQSSVYYYRNSSIEALGPNTTTIFNQKKILSIIPRLINLIIWILNFLAITQNFKFFLRAFKRPWIYMILPCKYPRNFALYLNNFVNFDIGQLNFKPKSCENNIDFPCRYTKNNHFLVASTTRGWNFMKIALIVGYIGCFCMNKIGRERNTIAKNFTFLFFWIKVSLEFNNFTKYCCRILYVGLHQNKSLLILVVSCSLSMFIFGILSINDYYKKIGFHIYKVPYSKAVRFQKKLVEKNLEILKKNKKSENEENRKKIGKPLKSILKIKTVPSDKRVLITIELFKRLAFSVDYDNFKIVPFNFLNNLKSLFSILLIILLENYPLICCLSFLLTQFLMTYFWLKENKGLMQKYCRNKIILELIIDLIFDSSLFLLTIFPSLSYSYGFGLFLQIFHFSTIILKAGFFFLGLYIEFKRFKARKKLVGGLDKLKYHKKMGFGVIKQKIRFMDERDRKEDEMEESDSKFYKVKDYDYERGQFKLTGNINKITPLARWRMKYRREMEVKRIVDKVNKKIVGQRKRKGSGQNRKVNILNKSKRRRSLSVKRDKILHLNKVKRMMQESHQVMEIYGSLKTDDEKFRFIYEFI